MINDEKPLKTAGDCWNVAESYYGEKDYENAWKCYLKATKLYENDKLYMDAAWGWYQLGYMCEYGQGVPVNLEKAKEYYKQAVEQEHKPAKRLLILIEHSEVTTAEQWYNLIKIYYDNEDYFGAIICYEEAEKLGYKDAQKKFLLQNYSNFEADNWYNLAEKNIYYYWKKACYEIAVAQNEKHVESLYQLGVLYSSDRVPFKDFDEAKKCFKQAAQQGHETSLLFFAEYPGVISAEEWYALSESYQQNGSSALCTETCYIFAAMQGHEKAKQQFLAPYRKDYKSAVEWYELAVYHNRFAGEKYAKYLASLFYEEVISIKPDDVEAFHVKTLRALARLYSEDVEGVKKDPVKAERYRLLAEEFQKQLKHKIEQQHSKSEKDTVDNNKLKKTQLLNNSIFGSNIKKSTLPAAKSNVLSLKSEQDANSTIKNNNKVENKLHLAIKGHFSLAIIKALIKDEKIPIDSCNGEGNTTLHLAVMSVLEKAKSAKEVDGQTIQFLLSNGADPHKKNKAGYSAVEIAEKSNCAEMKEIFKQHQEVIEKMLQQAFLANDSTAARFIIDKYKYNILYDFVKNYDVRQYLYEIYTFLRNPQLCTSLPDFFKQNVDSECAEWFKENQKNILATGDPEQKDRLILSKKLYREIINIAYNSEDKIAKEITLIYQEQISRYLKDKITKESDKKSSKSEMKAP